MKYLGNKTYAKISPLFALFLAILALFLSGCAKPAPLIKTQYKDVFIATPCKISMPKAPKFEPQNAQSFKQYMEYLLTCEELLKRCSR